MAALEATGLTLTTASLDTLLPFARLSKYVVVDPPFSPSKSELHTVIGKLNILFQRLILRYEKEEKAKDFVEAYNVKKGVISVRNFTLWVNELGKVQGETGKDYVYAKALIERLRELEKDVAVEKEGWEIVPSKEAPPPAAGGAGEKRVVDGAWPVTAQGLISVYERCWDEKEKNYNPLPFNHKEFIRLCKEVAKTIYSTHDPEKHCGYIEKKRVEPGTRIFVRSNLHGDLKSLTENLKTLQKEGLLDKEFKCLPKVQLVFLGDYVDIGPHSLQVLEILMRLRQENPTQVTLLRGDHEDAIRNTNLAVSHPEVYAIDESFYNFLLNLTPLRYRTDHILFLNQCFSSMPLALFIGEENEESVQYVMFSHGLFELYVDPAPMLCTKEPHKMMPVASPPYYDESAADHFTARMSTFGFNPGYRPEDYASLIARCVGNKPERHRLKLEKAALVIHTIAHEDRRGNEESEKRTLVSSFTSGMIAPKDTPSTLGSLIEGKWVLSATDVKEYFRVISTEEAMVKALIRGGGEVLTHHTMGSKIVVTTLPKTPGLSKNPDSAYLLTTAKAVKAWQKQLVRKGPDEYSYTVSKPETYHSDKV